MMKAVALRRFGLPALAALLAVQGGHAATPARDDVTLIRNAENAHSEVVSTVRVLADSYGPRLTASPADTQAARWAVARLASWGLKNAHLEPWVFGHPGWQNIKADGQLLLEDEHPLSFGVAAWTPGTNGPIAAQVVRIDPPEDSSPEVLDGYLRSVRQLVRGRIVMIGRPKQVTPEAISRSLDPDTVAEVRSGKAAPYEAETSDPHILTRRQRSERIDAFLVGAQAAMRVDDAGRPYGVVGARANLTFDTAKSVPSVVLRHEDYSRIVRLLDDDHSVRMRFDIRNRSNPDGRIAYNVVADIPGSDKASELVILGAHRDSWHMATGAVDDGVGCAIMMEVGRLIQSLGLHPRRTIRIVLWSGEEQYLLGSQAYVAEHFGTAEQPGREFGRLAAYVNIDGGSGNVRGANIFGPPEAATMVRDMLKQIGDPAIEGAIPHSVRKLGSTDATTFSRAGMTSIGLIQDPLDYSVAWHGNLDTFERVDEAQAKQAVIVGTVLALSIADRAEMPPKFEMANMPVPIGAPPATFSGAR